MGEIVLLCFGLSIDAFIITAIISMQHKGIEKSGEYKIAILFAVVQSLMLLLGIALNRSAGVWIGRYMGYIASFIFIYLGIMTIKERKESIQNVHFSLKSSSIYLFAFSSSVDAFLAGVSLGTMSISTTFTLIVSMLVTYFMAIVGFKIGGRVSQTFEERSELIAGVIFMILGLEVLLNQ